MADVKKIATRMGYGAALRELGALHDNIVVFDADLAGSTQTATFGKAFPDRHFNCGIAEGNMIAVAAGASTMGLVPSPPPSPCSPPGGPMSRCATPSATPSST